jgi:hypothetical protein
MIVVDDAERLEREVAALERALEYDGVRVWMVWAKDAVRYILVMAAWDERVRAKAYGRRLVVGSVRFRVSRLPRDRCE